MDPVDEAQPPAPTLDRPSERFSLFGLVNADLRDIAQSLDGCHFEVIIAARR